jgi:hypothetical protein
MGLLGARVWVCVARPWWELEDERGDDGFLELDAMDLMGGVLRKPS